MGHWKRVFCVVRAYWRLCYDVFVFCSVLRFYFYFFFYFPLWLFLFLLFRPHIHLGAKWRGVTLTATMPQQFGNHVKHFAPEEDPRRAMIPGEI